MDFKLRLHQGAACKREDDIKMDLQEVGWGRVLDGSGSG